MDSVNRFKAKIVLVSAAAVLFTGSVRADPLIDSLANMIDAIYGVAAGIAALLIVLQAVKYKTAAGPVERDEAKRGILNVVIGLAILLVAGYVVGLIYYAEPVKTPAAIPRSGGTTRIVVSTPTPSSTTSTTSILTSTSSTTTSTTLTTLSACDEYRKSGTVPASWDWKNVNGKNYVSGVRDQHKPHNCGSCWAHATCGCLEGTINVEKDTPGTERNLAEQYLVSTCFPPADCGGIYLGDEPNLFRFLKTDGVPDEACYTYLALNSQCSGRCSDYASRVWKITSYGHPTTRIKIQGELICHGPMFVGSTNWGHAITLVGYNAKGWIIKNSWGTGWSNSGQPPGFGVVAYNDAYGDLADDAFWVQGVIEPS